MIEKLHEIRQGSMSGLDSPSVRCISQLPTDNSHEQRSRGLRRDIFEEVWTKNFHESSKPRGSIYMQEFPSPNTLHAGISTSLVPPMLSGPSRFSLSELADFAF